MANELEVAAKEAFWRDHFERQRDGGDSITSYCREHRLPQSSFYGWRQKLGKRGARRNPRSSGEPWSAWQMSDINTTAQKPSASHPVG